MMLLRRTTTAAMRRTQRRHLGYVELERDVVAPQHLAEYRAMLAAHAPTRHKVDKGYLGSFGVDVGRASSVYHLSVFEDYDQRDAREATEGLRFFHQGVQSLESSVFKEASATLNEAGLPGLQDGLDAVQGCAFELRTYELQLGYDTVPNFLEIYSGGLKDKMEHDDSGESRLISLLHSEAGVAPLNTVMELWRHESAQGAQRSRLASRKATSWRRAVNHIAELSTRFETQLLRPIL